MPLRAIYLVLALALCSRSWPTSPSHLSVVSAWMIFSIDSFVHPCRQICTCNQSPVDTGLITVLIWHPAAFLVLARTHTANHRRGGISELKMSLHKCSCCVKTSYLRSWEERVFKVSVSGGHTESAEEGKNTPNLQLHRQSLTTVRAYVIEAGIAVFLIPCMPAVICNTYCCYTMTRKSCQWRSCQTSGWKGRLEGGNELLMLQRSMGLTPKQKIRARRKMGESSFTGWIPACL